MVIYLEGAFAINFIMDYVLLRLAGRLWNRPPSLIRGLAAAAAGALWACLSLFRPLAFLGGPWACWVAAAVMILIGYGGLRWRELARLWVAMLGIAFLAAGGCQVVTLLIGVGQPSGSAWAIVAAGLALLMCGWTLVPGAARLQRKSLVRLRIQGVMLTALVDTGHDLCEPLSRLPVLVLDGFRAAKVLGAATCKSLEQGMLPPKGRWVFMDTVQGEGCSPTAYVQKVEAHGQGRWQELGPMYVMVAPQPLQIGLDALLAPHPRLQEGGRMHGQKLDSSVDGWV